MKLCKVGQALSGRPKGILGSLGNGECLGQVVVRKVYSLPIKNLVSTSLEASSRVVCYHHCVSYEVILQCTGHMYMFLIKIND